MTQSAIFNNDSHLPTLKGDRWRATHRASVVAILGDAAPVVVSKGTRFYNKDRWTSRFFVTELCDWAKKNPGCMPVAADVDAWTRSANSKKIDAKDRMIVIAATPNMLSMRVALALVGGGYHEAFHTLYSCRRNLDLQEMRDLILPRWALVSDWAPILSALLHWQNLIEDIRIERRGNERFPGILTKMCELHDFVLDQEERSRQTALQLGQPETWKSVSSVVSATFRDLGLGYDTAQAGLALEKYRADNPEAYDMVDVGPFRALLDESINLSDKDDLGSLRLALDLIAALSAMVSPSELDDAPKSGKAKCPKCGAPGNRLVIRPLSDGNGGRVKGKGVCTCTECGWQEIVDISDLKFASTKGMSKEDKENLIRFEDFPMEEMDGSDGEGDEGGDEGEGGGEGDEKDDGQIPEAPESSDPIHEPSTGTGKGPKFAPKFKKQKDAPKSQLGGGHHYDDGKVKPWKILLDEMKTGNESSLEDNNSSLETAIAAARDKEKEDCSEEELPWAPYNPGLDIVAMVGESTEGMSADRGRSNQLLNSVKSETSYLRSRLRNIVRAVEQREVVHGVRTGRDLSERMMVESIASIRSGVAPSRAYTTISDRVDTSIACAIVIDQSGSMGSILQPAAQCLMALAEPLDALGAAVLVAGFRDGPYGGGDYEDGEGGEFHRHHGIHHDVFKSFDEKFLHSKWRFANTRADGGTPMADGVQFGLDALEVRPEGHRVLFIITDGEPNGGHERIMKRQFRLAAQAGITIVGVGIGSESKSVMRLFPESVWASKIKEMPAALIRKLNTLLDFRTIKRGRMMKAN